MSLPQPDRGLTTDTPPGLPRWVKLSGVIALALILLLIIAMFVVGGNHSPSRHLPSSNSGHPSPSGQQVYRL